MWISSTGSTRQYVFAYVALLLFCSTAAAQADRDSEPAQIPETSAQLSHQMWLDSLHPAEPEILKWLFDAHQEVRQTNQRWPQYNPPIGVWNYLWGQPRSSFDGSLQEIPFALQVLPDSDGEGLWLLVEYFNLGAPMVSFMFCGRAPAKQPLDRAVESMQLCGLRILFKPKSEDERLALGIKATRYGELLDSVLSLFGGWNASNSSLQNSPDKITAAKLRWCGVYRPDRIPSCRVNLMLEVNPDDGFAMLLFATPLLYRHANALEQYAVKDNPLARLLYGSKYVELGCDGLVKCNYWYRPTLKDEIDVLLVSLRGR